MLEDTQQQQGTETSPLLPREEAIQHSTSKHDILAPNGVPVESDGPALERQGSQQDIDRTKQYEGLPEVKKQLKYILPALAIGIFLAMADQTVIISSYGRIGTDLNALNLTSWIATAYFLTLTSFQPLYGKLSDIFGRKACLLFAYTVFGIGCLFCGAAQTMPQLIAARAFAGIGAGGMTTVVSILLSDVVTLRERGKWQGYLNLVAATGASAGGPLGGILADGIGWRWVFFLQPPLCLLAFIAVYFTLHLPNKEDGHWKEKLRRVDFLGAVVLISAVFTLCLALDRGSNLSWTATISLVSIALSIALFSIFVFVEIKVAKEPFAPGHVIFNRGMIACYLCNFFSSAAWMGLMFYIPLYWQAVHEISATGAGVLLIPAILGAVGGSLSGGIFMQRTGKFYWLTVVAYACAVPGTLAIALSSGLLIDSIPLMIVGMCISSWGNGVGITSTLIGLIANANHEDQAVATACSYLFRSLGSVFGVSISATVANQVLRASLATELPKLGLPEGKAVEIADRVRESLVYLRRLQPAVREVVVECYARSTTAAFIFQTGLVACAALCAWFIREKALSR